MKYVNYPFGSCCSCTATRLSSDWLWHYRTPVLRNMGNACCMLKTLELCGHFCLKGQCSQRHPTSFTVSSCLTKLKLGDGFTEYDVLLLASHDRPPCYMPISYLLNLSLYAFSLCIYLIFCYARQKVLSEPSISHSFARLLHKQCARQTLSLSYDISFCCDKL
jgi:hypothetical protein